MPSKLRYQLPFEPVFATPAITPFHHSSSLPSQQHKPKMSLSQTYYIASAARSKLGREAARSDHDLRLLVGHANLLDSLMLELHDAEREQERWFNQTVHKAQKSEPRNTTIKWADTIVELPEAADEEDSEDSDSDSEFDESELAAIAMPRHISVPAVLVSSPSSSSPHLDVDDEEEEEDYYEDMDDSLPELALVRTHSHSPPDLVDDSDCSDDESPPASPPVPAVMDFSTASFAAGKDHKTTAHQQDQIMFHHHHDFVSTTSTPLIAALA